VLGHGPLAILFLEPDVDIRMHEHVFPFVPDLGGEVVTKDAMGRARAGHPAFTRTLRLRLFISRRAEGREALERAVYVRGIPSHITQSSASSGWR
jgi:hypothetical protein